MKLENMGKEELLDYTRELERMLEEIEDLCSNRYESDAFKEVFAKSASKYKEDEDVKNAMLMGCISGAARHALSFFE